MWTAGTVVLRIDAKTLILMSFGNSDFEGVVEPWYT